MYFALNTIFTALIFGGRLTSASPAPVPVEMASKNGTEAFLAPEFGINLGNTFNNNVAWVAGQSQCNNVPISAFGTNPCNLAFSLNGNSGFKVNGCGGGPLWITKDGSFWANCASFSERDNCGVHTTYHCL